MHACITPDCIAKDCNEHSPSDKNNIQSIYKWGVSTSDLESNRTEGVVDSYAEGWLTFGACVLHIHTLLISLAAVERLFCSEDLSIDAVKMQLIESGSVIACWIV